MREKEKREKRTDGYHIMYIKHKKAMYIWLILIIEMDTGFLGTTIANVYTTYSKFSILKPSVVVK